MNFIKTQRRTAIIISLLVWKTIRTDWVVIVPWYTSPEIASAWNTGEHDVPYYPPISPLWNPPSPQHDYKLPGDADYHIAESWGKLLGSWYATSSSGPRGPGNLRPAYGVMAIKIFGVCLFLWASKRLKNWLLLRRDKQTQKMQSKKAEKPTPHRS